MTIRLIPDGRNEDKITIVKHAMETLENEELEEFFADLICNDEEWFDAMYYAAEDRGNNDVLANWENYFKDLLLYDEKYNYAADCGSYEQTYC